MKDYELSVLIHPDLEMNPEHATDKVKDIITANGGEIIKEVNEGKKRLAYPIRKNEFAVYFFYEVKLPATAPTKISNTLNITDEVLRYLLVSVDPRKLKAEARRQARRAAESAASDKAAVKE